LIRLYLPDGSVV